MSVRLLALVALLLASSLGCALELNEPCDQRHAQDRCVDTAVCEALSEPAPEICRDCVTEIEGTRVCRLRCADDEACSTEDECVDVITTDDAGERVQYDVCLPRDRAA